MRSLLSALIDRANALERRTLLSLLLAALPVVAFALLASVVVEGQTRGLDTRVLLLFRVEGNPSVVVGPAWLKDAMRDITALGSTSVLSIIVAGAAGFLAVSGLPRAALMTVASVVSGVLLSSSLKFGFSRPRPELIPQDIAVYTASFPSGHTTLSAVVYLTLGALLCRTQASLGAKRYILCFAAFLTGIVGVSRVFLGVHWPTDVVAGWLVGGSWALFCWRMMLWLQSRRKVEA
jgi:undecaprenyl-diphosphatase